MPEPGPCVPARVIEVVEPSGGVPTRWDPLSGPTGRVALVLPGSGCTPSHPLLEFGRQALLQYGWTVQQVRWEGLGDVRGPSAAAELVCQQTRIAIDAETDVDRVLVLAESLGTFASPVVAEHGLDAIWMTPVFSVPASIEAMRVNDAAGSRQLLVGGLADPAWDSAAAGELVGRGRDVEMVELEDADHSLLVPGDVLRSVAIQARVSRAVDRFLVRTLG